MTASEKEWLVDHWGRASWAECGEGGGWDRVRRTIFRQVLPDQRLLRDGMGGGGRYRDRGLVEPAWWRRFNSACRYLVTAADNPENRVVAQKFIFRRESLSVIIFFLEYRKAQRDAIRQVWLKIVAWVVLKNGTKMKKESWVQQSL